MYVKLDDEVIELLCCPFCKSSLQESQDCFYCMLCGLVFPSILIEIGRNKRERVYDFRIHRPSYLVPEIQKLWHEAQQGYEENHNRSVDCDSLQTYLDELDSVKEIYTHEYHLASRVLDVGGHQGRLRHYLGDDVSLYVSIDPHINIFEGIERQKNLIKAYPCLREPCNFIAAHAEYLPFKAKSFDWIHMRSTIDHFADPYQAFLEAFRCCKTKGKLLVGLAIMEKLSEIQSPSYNREYPSLLAKIIRKLKRGGLRGLMDAIIRRTLFLKDDHIFRLTHKQLRDLFERTGWRVISEHWQKPPFSFCIYALAEAKESRFMAQ